MHHSTSQHRSRGFTLVEVLLVVIILGILAAVVVPTLGSFQDQARQTSFISDVRIFAEAATRYKARTGQPLQAADAGQVPAGWEPYVDVKKWGQRTPIGGLWHVEFDTFGVTSSFGVDFDANGDTPRDDAYMTEIDTIFDDGNLATGQFRTFSATRFYYVLEL